MISIVICGRDKEISPNLFNNINTTIGVPYELIYIDNSENTLNLFSAYNKGVIASNYELICFMHDDIIYKTTHWGSLVIDKFSSSEVGAIGVAGTPYVSYFPGPWWASSLVAQNIIQENKQTTLNYTSTLHNQYIAPVILLDGVWLCIRKSIFKQIHFDEFNFNGFHMYDMDISMQIFDKGYKLFCIYDILLEHKSIGKLNKNWVNNRIQFYKKWRKKLPLSIVPLSWIDTINMEFKNLFSFIIILLKK